MIKFAPVVLLMLLGVFESPGEDVFTVQAPPRVATMPANPIMAGADPHTLAVGETIWIYPTWSERGRQQFFAFSSTNLSDWERHGPVLDFRDVSWIKDDGAPVHYPWVPVLIRQRVHGRIMERF